MSDFQKWTVGLLGCLLAVMLILGNVVIVRAALRQASPGSRGGGREPLAVTGRGTVRARPDIFVGAIRVTAEGDKATQAQKTVHDKMKSILTHLTKMGVAEKDLQTSEFSLEPFSVQKPTPTRSYEYTRAGVKQWVTYPSGKTVRRYRATNILAFKLRQVDQAGNLVDGAIEAGAGSVDNVKFTVEDIRPLRKRARELAGRHARERANTIARSVGARLGRVLQVSETSDNSQFTTSNTLQQTWAQSASPPSPSGFSRAGDEDAMEPGTIEITASVNVEYALR